MGGFGLMFLLELLVSKFNVDCCKGVLVIVVEMVYNLVFCYFLVFVI